MGQMPKSTKVLPVLGNLNEMVDTATQFLQNMKIWYIAQ